MTCWSFRRSRLHRPNAIAGSANSHRSGLVWSTEAPNKPAPVAPTGLANLESESRPGQIRQSGEPHPLSARGRPPNAETRSARMPRTCQRNGQTRPTAVCSLANQIGVDIPNPCTKRTHFVKFMESECGGNSGRNSFCFLADCGIQQAAEIDLLFV